MTSRSSRIPEDFHTITPHLTVRSVAEASDFYRKAFGARELFRNHGPDGKAVVHCEMLLGASRFFMHDEFPEYGAPSPIGLGGSAVTLHLYVEDVDRIYEQATVAGAEVLMPLADQFWGDRYAIVRDPFGHKWSIASRIDDPSPKQMQQRAKDYFEENKDSM